MLKYAFIFIVIVFCITIFLVLSNSSYSRKSFKSKIFFEMANDQEVSYSISYSFKVPGIIGRTEGWHPTSVGKATNSLEYVSQPPTNNLSKTFDGTFMINAHTVDCNYQAVVSLNGDKIRYSQWYLPDQSSSSVTVRETSSDVYLNCY